MSANRSAVCVVVLNWNRFPETCVCVSSLLAIGVLPHDIVIVDNASDDLSRELLAERFPHCVHIHAPTNLGYGGGNNLGLRHALDSGYEFVLILNNDTVIVDSGFLRTLLEEAAEKPRAGMLGPAMVAGDNTERVIHGAGFIEWGRLKTTSRDVAQSTVCDWVTGAAVLVRSSAVRDVGLMPEEFFLYWEDVEWSVRMARKGWTVEYVPAARVGHLVSRSSADLGAVRTYYYLRNKITFFARNLPRARRWCVWVAYVAKLPLLALQRVKAVRPGKRLAEVRYLMLAYWDAWHGSLGRLG